MEGLSKKIKKAKKIWERLTKGFLGYIIYALLGIAAGYLFYFTLSLVLQTDLPTVAVLTNSMDHGINEWGAPCGKKVSGYKESFDNWWELCKNFYENIGISKEQFFSFPVKEGFKKGDMPIVQGSDNYSVGDVIVFSITTERIPIIHRIIKINPDETYQTKGDFNSGQNFYEYSVKKQQIHGRVIFIIPKLGYYKVILNYLFGV